MGRRQIYRGAYLFLRLDQDPVQQVDAAIRAIQYTSQKDLCLAIDFEELSFPETSPAPSIEAVQKVVSTALKRAASRLKCRPMLYTNPDVGDKYLNSPDFARYPLWIADWSQSPAPKLPAAWSNFAFWQRADHIKASPEPVDLDIFNGELSELAHLSRTLGRSAAIVSGEGSPQ
jgi:GH25 family lysozyme M1 (1,4-beta-N-acetylmuramidase)